MAQMAQVAIPATLEKGGFYAKNGAE